MLDLKLKIFGEFPQKSVRIYFSSNPAGSQSDSRPWRSKMTRRGLTLVRSEGLLGRVTQSALDTLRVAGITTTYQRVSFIDRRGLTKPHRIGWAR